MNGPDDLILDIPGIVHLKLSKAVTSDVIIPPSQLLGVFLVHLFKLVLYPDL